MRNEGMTLTRAEVGSHQPTNHREGPTSENVTLARMGCANPYLD